MNGTGWFHYDTSISFFINVINMCHMFTVVVSNIDLFSLRSHLKQTDLLSV